jgi:hypothetical protein
MIVCLEGGWELQCQGGMSAKYSQTCANVHLLTTATCQQRPAQIPCKTKPTMPLPTILDQPLNNGHPLNNSYFYGVTRVAVIHRFDCFIKSTSLSNILLLLIIKHIQLGLEYLCAFICVE